MGMLQVLDKIDRIIFLYLNGMNTPLSDQIWYTITNIPTWIPLYLLILMAVIWHFRWDAIWVIASLLLVVLLSDQFTSSFMKPFFGRLRPCHEPEWSHLVHVVKYCGGKFAFASGHAANSFGIATFVFLIFRFKSSWIKLLFLWAALVAYSRIMMGVHYPGDIIAGAAIGIFFGWLVYRLLEGLYFRIKVQPLVKD
jgi:undecaprenyl-diphosphatase